MRDLTHLNRLRDHVSHSGVSPELLIPLRLQIEMVLLGCILKLGLKAGDLLLPAVEVGDLAGTHVHRKTVTAAYHSLQMRGVVLGRRGTGYSVVDPDKAELLSLEILESIKELENFRDLNLA